MTAQPPPSPPGPFGPERQDPTAPAPDGPAAGLRMPLPTRSPGRSRWPRVAGALLIALLATGGGYGYWLKRNGAMAAGGPTPFATAVAQRGNLVVEVRGFGALEPAGEQEVPASADGVVGEVAVRRGQPVKEGDLLFTIVNDQLRNDLEQAQIEYELRREEVADALRVAPSALGSTRAEAGLTVQSPVAGRVAEMKLKPGEQVSEGATIASIVDDRRLRGQANLVPVQIGGVRAGQQVEFRFRDFPGEPIFGRVIDVASSAVAGDGGYIYPVTLEVDNPGLLKPGMEADAGISGDQGVVWTLVKFDRWAREERVKAPVSGVVDQVQARDGAQVRAGDALIRMERSGALTALRRKQLSLRQLELTLELKRKQVANLEVRSPIEGVVAELEATPGKKAELGKALARITDSSTMTLNLTIDELDIPKVRLDQDVTVTADALPGRTWKGKVVSIGSKGQQREGISAFTVQVRVFEPKELQAGMTARASIFVGQKNDVVMVPMEAVYDEQGQAMVQVLVDGKVTAVPVRVGLSNGRHSEILSGVEPGQAVVTGSATPLFGQPQRFGQFAPPPGSVRVSPATPVRPPAAPPRPSR